MMTNTKKASNWKYLLTLPAIALCFGLMSAKPVSDQNIRKDNITTFGADTQKGKAEENSVYEIIDPVTGEVVITKIKNADNVSDAPIFRAVSNKAERPSNWEQYLNESLKFPEKFKGDSVSVRIFMEFIIEKDGSTSEPKVLRSEGYINNNQATAGQLVPFTEEAIRVVSVTPKWQPATHNGSTVRSYYTLPITFRTN